MSAGVCVINKNGFALAADSAGTLSNNVIVYNSMNKVFSLSTKLPIGAIIYDHTTLNGVFIEQIMFEFKNYLVDKQIQVFDDIIVLFNKFISEYSSYYQFNKTEGSYCATVINELVTDWGGKLATEEVIQSTEKIADILNEFKLYIDTCKHVDADLSEYVKRNYRNIFEKKIDAICPNLKTKQEQYNQFWDYICQYFNLQMDCDLKQKVGMLIAGYGERDAFPKYIELNLYCVVGKILKYEKINAFDASTVEAAIQPLAQQDVILTFCKGISDTILNLVPGLISKHIESQIDKVNTKIGDDNSKVIKNTLKDIGEIIKGEINKQSRKLEVDPLMTAITCLPLTEMASLAENLINITTLRRTYAIDGKQRTVGGPTDVAIFAKGVPTKWFKQKELYK